MTPPLHRPVLKVVLFLFLAAYALPAGAYSPLFEIDSMTQDRLQLGFEIHSARQPNGDVQFTVKIVERSLKFREQWNTSLALVHRTTSGVESRGGRYLPAKREGDTITCTFTVTREELKDPDISFFFGMPVPHEPNIDHFCAHLNHYLPK